MPLTGKGWGQALRAARGNDISPTPRLYASPFLRAWMTAAIVGLVWRRWPRILPEAYEVRKAPVAQQQPSAPYMAFTLQSFARMLRPGLPGESWYQSIRRAHSLWRKLDRKAAETDIALVTHGQLIRLLLLLAWLRPRHHIRHIALKPGGVSVIDAQ